MKLLIADDHDLFRSGLAVMLRHQLGDDLVVREADSYRSTLAALSKGHDLDAVICDLNMPDLSAWRHLGQVVDAAAPAPVVVCSATFDGTTIQSVRAMGAAGFVSKNASLETVVAALDAVRAGDSFFPEAVEPAQAPRGGRGNGPAGLTPAEQRVLAGLVQGLSNKEIARREEVSQNAVKIHLKRIFAKLGVTNRTQAALRAAQILKDESDTANVAAVAEEK